MDLLDLYYIIEMLMAEIFQKYKLVILKENRIFFLFIIK